MAVTTAKTLKDIEDHIKQGRGALARKALLAATRRNVRRPQALLLAAFARRSGAPLLGVRLLHRYVHGQTSRVAVEASPAEKAEYAACLTKLGAAAEARFLLRTVDAAECPEALLFESFALVSEWSYREAIPLLSRYVRETALSPYQRLVGQVNLAAALVYERRHLRAEALLRELLHETSVRKHWLLLGNALELSAANFVFQRDYGKAAAMLEKAQQMLRESATIGELFVRKWQAILALARTGGDAESKRLVAGIRQEAQSRGHWETVRDCDRFVAIHTRDLRLAIRVWFGTPYESFRSRLVADFGDRLALPESYEWFPGGRGDGRAPRIDLLTGEAQGKAALKPGKGSHRLLSLLASDFYRPFRIAPVHLALFPGEFFNPLTSAHRVHGQIRLLRARLDGCGLPLELVHEDGAYSLAARSAVAIRVRAGEALTDRHHFPLWKLRTAWPREPFSVSQAEKVLGVSRRSTQRALDEGLRRGTLTREGAAAATRYRFAR